MISKEQGFSHSYWRQRCRHISGKCLARACYGWNGFLVLSVQHVLIPLGISVFGGTETSLMLKMCRVIHAIDPKDCDHDLFRLLHYAVKCSNGFYRLLHWRGLWLGVDDCRYASNACHEMIVSWFIYPGPGPYKRMEF